MKTIISFALAAVLTSTFSSCTTHQDINHTGFLQQSGWSVNAEEHLPQVGWNVDTLCTYCRHAGERK